MESIQREAILKVIDFIKDEQKQYECDCSHCRYGYQKKYSKKCEKERDKLAKKREEIKNRLTFWENKLKEN